jgi:hypothetical protein
VRSNAPREGDCFGLGPLRAQPEANLRPPCGCLPGSDSAKLRPDQQLSRANTGLALAVPVSTQSIWKVHVASGRERQVTRSRNDSSPSWSPDGRWIAFHRGSSPGSPRRLMAVRPDGTGERVIAATDAMHAGHSGCRTGHPNGRCLAIDAGDLQDTGVALVSSSGGPLRYIMRFDDAGLASPPSWSPDRRRLVVAVVTSARPYRAHVCAHQLRRVRPAIAYPLGHVRERAVLARWPLDRLHAPPPRRLPDARDLRPAATRRSAPVRLRLGPPSPLDAKRDGNSFAVVDAAALLEGLQRHTALLSSMRLDSGAARCEGPTRCSYRLVAALATGSQFHLDRTRGVVRRLRPHRMELDSAGGAAAFRWKQARRESRSRLGDAWSSPERA